MPIASTPTTLPPLCLHEIVDIEHAVGFVGAMPLGTLTLNESVTVADKVPEAPNWSAAARSNLLEIRKLKPGWNGAGSCRISDSLLYRADRLLRDAMEGAP